MICDTDIPDLDPALSNYNPEEADTGIVLHAIDVARQNPFHILQYPAHTQMFY